MKFNCVCYQEGGFHPVLQVQVFGPLQTPFPLQLPSEEQSYWEHVGPVYPELHEHVPVRRLQLPPDGLHVTLHWIAW